jgi:hypothetical protein
LSAGFLSNYEKSVWKPQRSLEWLGFVWNLDLYRSLQFNKKLNKNTLSGINKPLSYTRAR